MTVNIPKLRVMVVVEGAGLNPSAARPELAPAVCHKDY
jgi:hypothetical protein